MATMSPYLVWMDLEMTGLEPEKDVIIEMATLITDHQLQVVAEGPTIAIQRSPELFASMDNWNQTQHTKSGLWQRVIMSEITAAEAEAQTLAFIKKYVPPKASPLCGNSIWQDRRFIARYMPSIDQYLHYRMIDVSTIKELSYRWYPQEPKFESKSNSHRALDDIRDSIEELKYYRERFFKAHTPSGKAD